MKLLDCHHHELTSLEISREDEEVEIRRYATED